MSSTHSIGLLNGEMVGDPLDIEMLKATGFSYKIDQEESNNLTEAIIDPSKRFKDLYENTIRNSVNFEEKSSTNSLTSDSKDLEFAVIKRFDFSSELQRMSVITRGLNDINFRLFTKGSPEKIKQLSIPESIPTNFNEVLDKYTRSGLRVLALACKLLPKITYNKV